MTACTCGLALAMLAAVAGSAPAASLSACTPRKGTIVAVDFAHWGGPIVRGCGIGQRTGYALLHAAGFTTAGDLHDGPAFICRIGEHSFRDGTQYPTPREDRCVNTPPTSRYWSFWTAKAGQHRWSYDPLGAMGDVPQPGEVELWTFGATSVGGTSGSAVPSFTPDTLRPRTTSAPSATPATTHSTTTTSSTTTPATTTSTSPTRTRAPSRPHQSKTPTSANHKPRTPNKASTPNSQTQPTTTTAPAVVAATPATDQHHSSGSAGSLIVGLCLVALLAAGAGSAAWRRRRDRYE
jgi:hypothetical protein